MDAKLDSPLKAQEEWRKATQKFDTLKTEMNDALMQRDDAYLRLIGAVQPQTAIEKPRPGIYSGWGGLR